MCRGEKLVSQVSYNNNDKPFLLKDNVLEDIISVSEQIFLIQRAKEIVSQTQDFFLTMLSNRCMS